MDNENDRELTPEERLDNITEERRRLRPLVEQRREVRLAEAAKHRKVRDAKINSEEFKLKKIKSLIYRYTKCPTTEKLGICVLGKIREIIDPAVQNDKSVIEQTDG